MIKWLHHRVMLYHELIVDVPSIYSNWETFDCTSCKRVFSLTQFLNECSYELSYFRHWQICLSKSDTATSFRPYELACVYSNVIWNVICGHKSRILSLLHRAVKEERNLSFLTSFKRIDLSYMHSHMHPHRWMMNELLTTKITLVDLWKEMLNSDFWMAEKCHLFSSMN